jgi:hypothetical protein
LGKKRNVTPLFAVAQGGRGRKGVGFFSSPPPPAKITLSSKIT